MYVLPTSTTEALLEYTLFSHDRQKKSTNRKSKNTLKTRHSQFRNNRKEQGSIPMTCYPFGKTTKRVLNIGTAEDGQKQVQAIHSKNSDKKSTQLVAFLQEEKDLRHFIRKPSSGFTTCCC
jgi:lycopene beta-cyclase